MMDTSDLLIEGAGFVLLAALVAGAFAAAYERRRLLMGLGLGLGVAVLALPFIAYLVARLTNHQATQVDLTPPAYVVVTALACAGLALAGLAGGALAEVQRRRRGIPTPPRSDPDENYIDDPTTFVPWLRKAKDAAKSES
jgi:peptidoglycan/LPS O-acetylase OafA/YrhL